MKDVLKALFMILVLLGAAYYLLPIDGQPVQFGTVSPVIEREATPRPVGIVVTTSHSEVKSLVTVQPDLDIWGTSTAFAMTQTPPQATPNPSNPKDASDAGGVKHESFTQDLRDGLATAGPGRGN